MKKLQRKIVIVVGGLGLAMALIFGITTFNTPNASAQTATPAATTAAPKTAAKTPGAKAKHLRKQGRIHVVATVTAINGDQLSLGWRNWTQTVTVGSSVKITEGGKTITFGDIKVGDQVVLHFAKSTTGQKTLSAIRVIQPHAAGTVSAVNGTSFTIQHKAGKAGKTATPVTVTTNSSTVFTKGKKDTASLSDVTVNSRVVVVGTKNADGSLTATHVYIGKAKAAK